jgi:gluconokinase
MTEKLLKSQFYDLEEPNNCICVDVSESLEVIVEKIIEQISGCRRYKI